jgi:hypothetical protein
MADIKALSVKHPVLGLLGLVLSVYSSSIDKNTPLSLDNRLKDLAGS